MGLHDVEGKRLKKNEVTQLLADKRWKEDPILTKFFGEAKTYVHPEENSVLSVDWNGKGGMLFLDKEAIYRVVADPDALKPRHVLEGLFDHGTDFPSEAAKLAANFSARMSAELGRSVNTDSIEPLRLVDDYVAMKGAKRLLQPDVFPGLLAYVGEVLRKNYSMTWKMSETASGVWEPWLVDDAGNEYPIFAPVHKELYEYRSGHSSVYGAVMGEIRKNGLVGGGPT